MLNHEWLFPNSIVEAKSVQHIMAENVLLKNEDTYPKYIAGMDVSNNLFDPTQMIYASAVVLSFPELELIETAALAEVQKFPYVTGLLGFREAPALINAFNQLKVKPDLIMVDGHGISHPRGLGIASHIGVLLDIPTIGVAKSILIGTPIGELKEAAGAQVPLFWKGREIARVLRTKTRCNPLYISAGHRITLDRAVELVERCLKGYRLPECTRQAHLAANACRKNFLQKGEST